jgi:hypothetical protein
VLEVVDGLLEGMPREHRDRKRDDQTGEGVRQVVVAEVLGGPAEAVRMEEVEPVADLTEVGQGPPAEELRCQRCQSPLRLIALVKNRDIAKKILTAMHLPTEVPELHPARPPPGSDREARDAEDWPEDWLN